MGVSNNYEIFEFNPTLSGDWLFADKLFAVVAYKKMTIQQHRFSSCSGVLCDSISRANPSHITKDEEELLHFNYDLSQKKRGSLGSENDGLYLIKMSEGRFLKRGLKTVLNMNEEYNGLAFLAFASVGVPSTPNYATHLDLLYNTLLERGMKITNRYSVPRNAPKPLKH